MGFFGKLLNKSRTLPVVAKMAPNQIGVYIFSYKGKVVYVGRAIEDRPGQATKGLRKRLLEHARGSNCSSNQIRKYRDEITVSMRTCQNEIQAKELEANLIRKHNTVENGWNKRYEY